MTNPDELLRLAERVEQGSGEDFQLRKDIFKGLPREHWLDTDILTSLDAVEALRELLLPGSRVEIIQDVEGRWGTAVRRDLVDPCHGESLAPTEPRARLAALLRAAAGKEGQ